MIKMIKKYKLWIVATFFSLLFSTMGIDFYFSNIVPSTQSLVSYQHSIDKEKAESGAQLKQGDQYVQTFKGVRDELLGFSVVFDTFGEISEGKILVELIDNSDGNIYQSWEVSINELENWGERDFIVSSPITDAKDKFYSIRLTVQELKEDSLIGIVQSNDNNYTEGDLLFNGQYIEKDMDFYLKGTTGFLKKIYIVLFLLIIVAYWLTFWGAFIRKWEIHRIFWIVGFTFGMIYMVLFPPCTTCDEYTHLATTYSNANILMMRESEDKNGNVLVRKEDTYISDTREVSKNTFNQLYNIIQKQEVEDEVVSLPRGRMGYMLVTAHAPQTIGIIIGWLLNLNAVFTVYLGKLTGLLWYLFFCSLGIKYIPWGKMSLFIVSLLPLSLELAGSFSYDNVINSMAFFFIGYTLYLEFEKDKVTWKDILLLTVVACIFVPIKIAYMFICILIFFVPKEKYKKRFNYYWASFMVSMSGILLFASQKLFWFLSFFGSTNEQSGFDASVPGYTIGEIIRHPLESARFLVMTIYYQGDYYFRSMLGTSLSWASVELPALITYSILILLLLSTISNEKEVDKQCFSAVQKNISYVLCAVMFGGIILIMWLAETPITATNVVGVQGRYFLTFLPILLLCMRNKVICAKKDLSNTLIMGLFLIQYLSFFVIWRYIG